MDEWPYLLHAEFTPKGQSIVLVYEYDIYYRPSARALQAYRLTKNAIPGIVYNGVPDWLYEGEWGFFVVVGRTRADMRPCQIQY